MFKRQKEGLHLAEYSSDEELLLITQMYARTNPIGFIPVDITKGVISFRNGVASGGYLRLIKVDNTIHGFIAGMLNTQYHNSERTVQQMYYYCDLEGIEAFRAVVIAHEGLVRYAEGLKAKNITSACSQLYTNENFVKILRTQGWSVFGTIALWRTTHHDNPSRNPRSVTQK